MNYPIGTYNDPRAPWNQEECAEEQCRQCGGRGRLWYIFDSWDNSETRCAEDEWLNTPANRAEAAAMGETVRRGRVEQCPCCCGTGLC